MHLFVSAPRSPTWRTIQTGTQRSSTTEKALCQKTTSTCGHTRTYTLTLQLRASSSGNQINGLHTFSSDLSQPAHQWGCVRRAAPGAFCSALDICTLAWGSITEGESAPLPALHNRTIQPCTRACVWVYSKSTGTRCISPSDGFTPAGFFIRCDKHWSDRTAAASSSALLISTDVLSSWSCLVKSTKHPKETLLGGSVS